MGVRPSISQLIGISGLAKQTFQQEIKAFLTSSSDTDFLQIAQSILEKTDDGEDLIEEFAEVEMHEVFKTFSSSQTELFGMLPVFQFKESSSYNDPLIWAMIEAGMLESQTRAFKIPYGDYSSFIGKERAYLIKHVEELIVRSQLVHYQGKWGRLYPHSSISEYDDELEFTYRLFHKIGIMIKRSDLDRYMIFEWI